MKRLYPISSQTPTIVYAKIALASVAMSSVDGFLPLIPSGFDKDFAVDFA
jgi:hypothetical protein